MFLSNWVARAAHVLQASAVYASPRYADAAANRYWSSATRTHTDTSPEAFDFYFAKVREIVAPKPGDRILDFGCGSGELAERFRREGFDVTGTDISAALLERAKARGVPTFLWKSDARSDATNGDAGIFDTIYANGVFLCVHPKRRTATLRALRRRLKPGGTLYVLDEPDHDKRHLLGLGRAWHALTELVPTYLPDVPAFFMRRADFETSAHDAGFGTVKRSDSWCEYRSHFVVT